MELAVVLSIVSAHLCSSLEPFVSSFDRFYHKAALHGREVLLDLFISTSIYLSIYGCIALIDLGRFFSFLIYTQLVGLLARGISPPQSRYLTQTENKHKQIYMP
jgi:hypothetical protein